MLMQTVGDLKALLADLPDTMLVRGMEDEIPLMFVADYEDVPEETRPEPQVIIEL